MNYFRAITKRAEELDELAKPYLENRPNWSLEDLAHKNCKLAYKIFIKNGRDWNKVPEIVADIMDGWLPFSNNDKPNGSIYHTLGLSLASKEAHAWSLYDYLSGKKDSFNLPFGVVAESSEVDRILKEHEPKKEKKKKEKR